MQLAMLQSTVYSLSNANMLPKTTLNSNLLFASDANKPFFLALLQPVLLPRNSHHYSSNP